MNVKIFTGMNISVIQDEINEWLAKRTRKIKFVTQSESCGSDGGEFSLTITVFCDE